MISRNRKRSLRLILATGAPALAMVSLSGQAWAQEAAESRSQMTLEEIVVTAQKRRESARDVPASISAVSGEQLETLNATKLTDYANYIPGFQVDSSGPPGLTSLTIRGITTGSRDSATVGTYVDDVPVGSSSSYLNAGSLALDLLPYDIERVEVLRGPQGTLYGASAMGGLLKYVTRSPSLEEFELRAGGDVTDIAESGDLSWSGRASVNLPIVDGSLAVRASGFRREEAGFIDNVASGDKDVNSGVQDGGRVALLWQATDHLSLKLTGMVQNTEYEAASTIAYDPVTQRPAFGYYETSRFVPESFEQRQELYAATLNWSLGWADLTSASSYSDMTTRLRADGSATFLPLFGVLASFETPLGLEKFTQEVRLASPSGERLEWLVGAFYTDEDANFAQNGTAFIPGTDPLVPVPGVNPLLVAELPSSYREFAVFGDATYKFTDAFDMTVGLRWSTNDQSFEQRLAGLLVGPPSVIPGKSSDEVMTYMTSARYHINEDAMIYARLATGYRAGGPNLALADVPPTFDPDTLTNYELGFKSQFLDKRAFLDIAVFRIDWQDIQISDSTPSAISFNRNGGEAVSQGFEFSGGLLPVEGLRLGVTAAYTDATLSQDVPALSASKGDRVPTVPQWSGSFTANYERPLWGDFTGRLGGGYRYAGERNSRFPGGDPSFAPTGNIPLPAYDAVDANIGVFNDRLTVSLYARNVTNERAYLSGGTRNVTILQPRTVGLSVDLQF